MLGSKARENKTKEIILGSAMNTTFLWFYSPTPLLLKCCEHTWWNRVCGYIYMYMNSIAGSPVIDRKTPISLKYAKTKIQPKFKIVHN